MLQLALEQLARRLALEQLVMRLALEQLEGKGERMPHW